MKRKAAKLKEQDPPENEVSDDESDASDPMSEDSDDQLQGDSDDQLPDDWDDQLQDDSDDQLQDDSPTPNKKPKLAKSSLYKPPTNEELQELKETENLFQSSLFRMQISELLKEVKMKNKHTQEVDELIANLKEVLLKLPSIEKTEITQQKFLKKMKVKVPFHQEPFDVKGKFMFLPPKNIKIIGSYLTGTTTRPDTSIDIAVEMPKGCFESRDYLNQRYLRKRALYVACMAAGLRDCHFVEQVMFSQHHCGHLLPILLVKPAGKCGKHFTVNIHPYPENGAFKVKRFHVNTSNVRQKWYKGIPESEDASNSKQEEEGPATPYYNSAVLADLTMMQLNEELQSNIAECPGLQDGLVLLKVWLRQRQLNSVCGGFSNFLMTMFVLCLLKKRKVNKLMSSYQVMRNTLIHLGQASWDEQGISLQESTTDEQPQLGDFHRHFETVFIDTTGYLNLCPYLNTSVLQRVQHEAKLSITHLESLGTDGFEALFMSPVPLLRKFDQVFYVYDLKHLEGQMESEDDTNTLMDMGGDYITACLPRMLQLLRQGLTDRAQLIQLQPTPPAKWACDSSVPAFDHMNHLAVGVLLNKVTCNRLVTKGPAADSKEAQAFREFWGEKSTTRRFKDGSTLEAVVFSGPTVSKQRRITATIVRNILSRHLNIKHVKFVGCELDDLLQLAPYERYQDWYGTGEEQLSSVVKLYDELCKQLRSLDELPLAIHSIQTISPALRYTQVFPALPALEDEPVVVKGDHQVPKVDEPPPLLNPSINVQCLLEPSGKWPDDLEAVKRLKAAFHVKLAEGLRQCKLLTQAFPTHVLVYKRGLVFRVEIGYLKEISLLRLIKTPDGLVKTVQTEAATALERHLVGLPKLCSAIKGLQALWPSYSSCVRLVKRWIAAQMMADYISDEALELITAYVFIHPAPFTPPGSPQQGFMRVLYLLASFDWKLAPLIINFNDELSKKDYNAIQNHFRKNRSTLPLMFLACPYDRMASVCTRHHPDAPFLQRISLLAKESLDVLTQQLSPGLEFVQDGETDTKLIFRPPLEMYDVLIELRPLQLSQSHQAVDVNPKEVPLPFYKQLTEEADELLNSSEKPSLPVVDYDPAALYLQELRESYSDLAAFFYDPFGGRIIGVLWKPGAFDAHDFKVSRIAARMPKLQENRVQLVSNIDAIIEDFKTIGDGLVKQIVLQSKSTS